MIENGGFGATIAGPIASLMIEKYLKKKISRTDLEVRVLNKSLQSEYAKLGGLSENVKKEIRIKDSIVNAAKLEIKRKDSIAKSKRIIPKTKADSIKRN
jgi:penicillin-binding protein 2